ncbi:MAG: hypothetical protein ACYDC0_16490 [Acidimicrobiales bacterium]
MEVFKLLPLCCWLAAYLDGRLLLVRGRDDFVADIYLAAELGRNV